MALLDASQSAFLEEGIFHILGILVPRLAPCLRIHIRIIETSVLRSYWGGILLTLVNTQVSFLRGVYSARN